IVGAPLVRIMGCENEIRNESCILGSQLLMCARGRPADLDASRLHSGLQAQLAWHNCASAMYSSTGTSSARRVSEKSVSTPRSFSQAPRVWRRILRRWEKATATIFSNSAGSMAAGVALGTMRTTAESTRGGGVKAEGGTSTTDSMA